MEDSISVKDIYQQNLNFLIGSGASYGLFPTLWLPIKDSNNQERYETFESLVTKLREHGKTSHVALMFMFYYKSIIHLILNFNLDLIDFKHKCTDHNQDDCDEYIKLKTINNYTTLIETIVMLLREKKKFERRCNIFTTNYDGCFPFIADKLLQQGDLEFIINDGARGFFERTISARHFNSYICQTGVFGSNVTDIPQLNLINLHGSAYWKKKESQIEVHYLSSIETDLLPVEAHEAVASFSKIILDELKTTEDILTLEVDLSTDCIRKFWESYKKLPIVNPTKWKFYETVFEEHYYQMLRLLSYELERPNTILITFGFSFADEHILNLVKRSLPNPRLQVYICCFNEYEFKLMNKRFGPFKNVKLIYRKEDILDFSVFNEYVFNTRILKGEL